MSSSSWMFPTTHTIAPYGCVKDVFTPAQCEEIIRIGTSNQLHESSVGADRSDSVRRCRSNIIEVKGNERIFKALSSAAILVNDQYFSFDLAGFAEGIIFLEYNAPAGKYESHVDCQYSSPVRKLSISVQLSDEAAYVGGDIVLTYSSKEQLYAPRTQGSLVAFPSYVLHEVKPITEGTRYSLVGWITGPQFK